MNLDHSASRDLVLAATIAALGEAAPQPGTPRHGHLQVQIAVLLEDGKADNPRFLSDQVRDALIGAIAEYRRQADDMVDIVLNGHHGLAYASDAHVISHALELSYEDIMAAGSDARAFVPLDQNILEDLSGPQAIDVVLQSTFDPQDPGAGLLGSLSAELTRRNMPNPYQAAIAEMLAEELDSKETARDCAR